MLDCPWPLIAALFVINISEYAILPSQIPGNREKHKLNFASFCKTKVTCIFRVKNKNIYCVIKVVIHRGRKNHLHITIFLLLNSQPTHIKNSQQVASVSSPNASFPCHLGGSQVSTATASRCQPEHSHLKVKRPACWLQKCNALEQPTVTATPGSVSAPTLSFLDHSMSHQPNAFRDKEARLVPSFRIVPSALSPATAKLHSCHHQCWAKPQRYSHTVELQHLYS